MATVNNVHCDSQPFFLMQFHNAHGMLLSEMSGLPCDIVWLIGVPFEEVALAPHCVGNTTIAFLDSRYPMFLDLSFHAFGLLAFFDNSSRKMWTVG